MVMSLLLKFQTGGHLQFFIKKKKNKERKKQENSKSIFPWFMKKASFINTEKKRLEGNQIILIFITACYFVRLTVRAAQYFLFL